MRHAITEPQTDRPERVGDCATQRNLTGLRRLLREAPGGTVLVTHTANIGEVTGGLSVAEGELLAMRDGRVVARVEPEELLNPGRTR